MSTMKDEYCTDPAYYYLTVDINAGESERGELVISLGSTGDVMVYLTVLT